MRLAKAVASPRPRPDGKQFSPALLSAEFSITGTWPMRTERAGRLRDTASNALASSIVLVCRPRPVDAGMTSRKDFVSSLRRELPEALREMQQGNIAPVDLAQAAIGPGMAVSRYKRVNETDGSVMQVRTALSLYQPDPRRGALRARERI